MSKKKEPSLEELTEIWYAKVAKAEAKKPEEERFVDIEQDEDNLKVWSSRFFLRHSIEQIQAKQVYTQMAENFLNDYKFKTRREEIIWEYHTKAISYRNISKLLKKVRIKMSHTSVQTVIRRLQMAMYLMYKTNEENPQ